MDTADTPEARLALIEADLQRLRPIAEDLPGAMLVWIRDGGDAAILDRVFKSATPDILHTEDGRSGRRLRATRGTALRPGPGFDPHVAGRYFRLLAGDARWGNVFYTLMSYLDVAPAPETIVPGGDAIFEAFAEAAAFDDADALRVLVQDTGAFDLVGLMGADRGRLVRHYVRRSPNAMYVGVVTAQTRLDTIRRYLAEELHAPDIRAIFEEALSETAPTDREDVAAVLRDADPDARREIGLSLLGARAAAARDGGALLLGDLLAQGDAAAREALEARHAVETAKGVARRIEVALARAEHTTEVDGYRTLDGDWIAIPAICALPQDPPVPVDPKIRLTALHEARTYRHYDHEDTVALAGVLDRIGAPDFDLGHELASRTTYGTTHMNNVLGRHFGGTRAARMLAAAQPPGRRVEIALACSVWLEREVVHLGTDPMSEPTAITEWLSTSEGDLRCLSSMLDTALPEGQNWAPDAMLAALLADYEDPEMLDPEAIWPFLAERIAELASRLMAARGPKQRARLVALVSMMPGVPEAMEGPLLEVARKDKGAGGQMAQRLLGLGTSRWERLMETALADADARRREEAAFLVARAPGATDWEPRLRALLTTEKKEPVRTALLAARATLGTDLSTELDAKALEAQAEAGLSKLRNPPEAWLTLDALPPLTLMEGPTLSAAVPRWWVAKAISLKRPGGDPLTDLWLGRLSEESAAALGAHVLDAWIAEDTRRRTPGEASDMAARDAQDTIDYYKSHLAFLRQNPGQNAQEIKAFTLPDLEVETARALRRLRSEIVGTGVRQTGLLALTARMEDAALARMAGPYLKAHAKRVAQAAALIEALAHHGGEGAIATLVAALPTLKKKRLREDAEARLAEIAEARGWTVDELGDRTAATGGLDADGTLALPVGEKGETTYEARLSEDFALVLRNPDGRTVRALPAGKDETTKAARKALATAKKAVPETVALQSLRLRHAMAAQRAWSGADWRLVFEAHPILKPLSQRLIWLRGALAFRPTAEGDLLDEGDAAVRLDATDEVRLAHPLTLGAQKTEVWAALLAEEEIVQPFDQLARPVLPPVDGTQTQACDRAGWTVAGSTLMAAASRLGWVSGGGGAFLMRRFDLPEGPLRARIDHSYFNSYEAPGAPVHIEGLSFWHPEGKRRHSVVPLAEVPPVLLAECRADVLTLTEAGEAPQPSPDSPT